MKIFNKSKTEEPKPSAEVIENTASTETEDAESKIESYKADIIELTESNVTLKASVETMTAENTGLKESNDTLTASLKASQAETVEAKDSAHKEAIQMLTEAGHAPIESNETTKESESNLYKQYRELQSSDPEAATKFWSDNKSQLINK